MSRWQTELAAAKLPLDTFWLDAGWNEGGFPLGQGNPAADATRFPRGLAPVGAAARQAGLRFLAWFEPERAMRGTWLDREHASWLLQPSGTPPELRYQERDGFRLLDLGNPEARRWAVDQVSQQIRDAAIDIYRQDCNLYPAHFWQTAEPPDGVGLREVRYITGLYEFLDELARRHPGLILDNCASGGRRLDFEMMRRCVVLWRSDSCWDAPSFPRNVQAMTHGLSLWLPLHGLGAAATDDTALRSGMGSCASFAINFRDSVAVETLRRHLVRYRKVRPLFTKDYYPLTPWTADAARLLAFQFHDPASGEGLVQVFPGTAATERSARLRLRGLDPAATLHVHRLGRRPRTRGIQRCRTDRHRPAGGDPARSGSPRAAVRPLPLIQDEHVCRRLRRRRDVTCRPTCCTERVIDGGSDGQIV